MIGHCIMPLFIGALVYLFFRADFFIGLPKITVQQAALKQIIFTLPDFCWSYSFASALYLFSIHYHLNGKWCVFLIFSIIAGSELVQLILPQYFTFDIFDLGAAVLAFMLSSVLIAKRSYEQKL